MDLDKKFRDMEQQLERKTRDLERHTRQKYAEIERKLGGGQAPATPAKGSSGLIPSMGQHNLRIDMSRERSLSGLDRIMEEDFGLPSYFDGSMAAYPTTYCETAREYLEPIIADIPMSDERRAHILARLSEAARAGAPIPILQSLGVHIPGVGCFVNGWLIGQRAELSPREAFESPAGFAEIVTTASHEKWGHGFITELTALGREKMSVQLGKIHLADQFEIRTVDTPDHARLTEQWRIIFFASNYVEEGYATWIMRYLAERIAELQPDLAERLDHAPAFTVEGILERLSAASGGEEAAEAISNLFDPESASLPALHQAMMRAIAAADNMGEGAFAQAVGMPAPYAVGFCIVNQIAVRHGAKVVPYAVATACNINYGLETISNQDLENYVVNHPDLNVNTRLAAMMYVSPGEHNDIQGFLNRARDEAGLASPW